MKMIAIATMLLMSQITMAGVRNASDMALVLQNEEVQTYLSSNHYNILKGIEHVGSARCIGEPTMYDLNMMIYTDDGYIKCTKRVVVGECGVTGLRTKVSLSSDISCE